MKSFYSQLANIGEKYLPHYKWALLFCSGISIILATINRFSDFFPIAVLTILTVIIILIFALVALLQKTKLSKHAFESIIPHYKKLVLLERVSRLLADRQNLAAIRHKINEMPAALKEEKLVLERDARPYLAYMMSMDVSINIVRFKSSIKRGCRICTEGHFEFRNNIYMEEPLIIALPAPFQGKIFSKPFNFWNRALGTGGKCQIFYIGRRGLFLNIMPPLMKNRFDFKIYDFSYSDHQLRFGSLRETEYDYIDIFINYPVGKLEYDIIFDENINLEEYQLELLQDMSGTMYKDETERDVHLKSLTLESNNTLRLVINHPIAGLYYTVKWKHSDSF